MSTLPLTHTHRKVGTGYTREGDRVQLPDGSTQYVDKQSKFHCELVLRLKYMHGITTWRPRTFEAVAKQATTEVATQ